MRGYDLAVIGGGPAGATLARLVGRHLKVLLVDRRPRLTEAPATSGQKCCGGLLAPDAQRLLSRLGLGLPRQVLVDPQIFVVRALDLASRQERFYQRSYLNMDRRHFEAWLLSLIPPGVDLRLGCRFLGLERQGEDFRLHLEEEGRRFTARTRLVAGADGAFSKVRRLVFPGHPVPPAYLAIQEWLTAEAPLPYFSACFDPAITDFYGWTIPKGDHLLVGAALLPRWEPAKRFASLKAKLGALGFCLGAPLRREGAWLLRPRKLSQLHTGERGVLLLGEAAGFISPSSAEGISYALLSALNLAEVLLAGSQGVERRYFSKTLPLRVNLLLKNLKAPFMFQPSLRRLILASGLNSVALHQDPGPNAPPFRE